MEVVNWMHVPGGDCVPSNYRPDHLRPTDSFPEIVIPLGVVAAVAEAVDVIVSFDDDDNDDDDDDDADHSNIVKIRLNVFVFLKSRGFKTSNQLK